MRVAVAALLVACALFVLDALVLLAGSAAWHWTAVAHGPHVLWLGVLRAAPAEPEPAAHSRALLLALLGAQGVLSGVLVAGISCFWPRRFGPSAAPLAALRTCRVLALAKAALAVLVAGEYLLGYLPALLEEEDGWDGAPFYGSRVLWLRDLYATGTVGPAPVAHAATTLLHVLLFGLLHALVAGNQRWRALNVRFKYSE